jgi:hypothetical protein
MAALLSAWRTQQESNEFVKSFKLDIPSNSMPSCFKTERMRKVISSENKMEN